MWQEPLGASCLSFQRPDDPEEGGLHYQRLLHWPAHLQVAYKSEEIVQLYTAIGKVIYE